MNIFNNPHYKGVDSFLLEKFNCFKDDNFVFDPKKHKYFYHNVQYTSVTQFIQNFHEKFDQDFWSKKKSEERGVDQQEILNEWKLKNDKANFVGSETHLWIENYFNGIYQELPKDLDIIDRINKFNIAYYKYLKNLKPVLFELRIFSKKYSLAGTIDSIFFYKDKLMIIDWKTNADFKTDEHRKGQYNKLLTPFEDYFQNHLNDYSIQVSLYSLILSEWNIDIHSCYLLHIGPNSEAKMYKAHDFKDKLKNYLDNSNFLIKN